MMAAVSMIMVVVVSILMLVMMPTRTKGLITQFATRSGNKSIPDIRDVCAFCRIHFQTPMMASGKSSAPKVPTQNRFATLREKCIDRSALAGFTRYTGLNWTNAIGDAIDHGKIWRMTKMIGDRRQPTFPTGNRNCNLHACDSIGHMLICQSLLT